MEGQAPSAGLLAVETPEAVTLSYELADAGSRGVALLLDILLLALVVTAEAAVLLGGLLIASRLSPGVGDAVGAWVVGSLIAIVFVTLWGYFILLEALRGRTVGKRRLGLRVLRDDGSRIGVLDSVVRNVLRLVDVLPGYYAVGLLAVLATERHKRVGDMAAGTVVVRDVAGPGGPLIPGGGGLRDELTREFLGRRGSMTAEGRSQVGRELLSLYGEVPEPEWGETEIEGRLARLAHAS